MDSERALPSVNDGEASAHQVRNAGLPHPAAGSRRAGSGRALAMAALVPVAAILRAACSTSSPAPPVTGTKSLIDGSAAGAYPIVNYEYAIVSTKQPSATRADDLKALLNWILTTGSNSTYLKQRGFQPLPAQVASISHALVAEISS